MLRHSLSIVGMGPSSCIGSSSLHPLGLRSGIMSAHWNNEPEVAGVKPLFSGGLHEASVWLHEASAWLHEASAWLHEASANRAAPLELPINNSERTCSTLNPMPCALNPVPCTLNPEPCSLNPEPRTRTIIAPACIPPWR